LPSSKNGIILTILTSSIDMVTLQILHITQTLSKSMYANDFPTKRCLILIFVVKDGVPFRNVQASISFDFCNKVCFELQSDEMSVYSRTKVIAYGSSLMKLDPGQCFDTGVVLSSAVSF